MLSIHILKFIDFFYRSDKVIQSNAVGKGRFEDEYLGVPDINYH